LFTQGLPQQSALVTHDEPGGGGFAVQSLAFKRQRGMPSASLRQQLSGFWLQKEGLGAPFGSQQLFSAEHASVLGLQMLPGSRHAVPLSHRPNSCAALLFAQVTAPFTGGGAPDQPQQSESLRQSSPVGEQPEGGWQTRKPPFAPVGAHTREQHVPPHEGAPPSVVPQIVPFTAHSVAPGAPSTPPQTPSSAPGCLVQLPEQHSVFVAHTSPSWTQNDTPTEQRPLLHSLEQHSPLAVHGLPEVLHVVLSGAHVPPPVPFGAHLPPQHSASFPHAWLSATHCFAEHWPPMHDVVQHSVGTAHAAPGPLQVVMGAVQTFCVQLAEQHSPLVPQPCPSGLQSGASAREPSTTASMKPPPAASSRPPSDPSRTDPSLPQAENAWIAPMPSTTVRTAAQGALPHGDSP
jgi:hypothetical protein